MNKKSFLFIISGLFLITHSLFSQQIALGDCWRNARSHYPLNDASIQLIEESTRQKLLNIKTVWLPQFELSAQATWQNDITHISSLSMVQNMPMAPKDQYKVGIDITQTLFDGKLSKSRSLQEKASGSIEKQNIEVKLRDVNYLVSEIFFTLLLLDEQKKQLDFLMEDINLRLNELSAAVVSGVLLPTERKILEVEKLKIEKQIIGLQSYRSALFQSLSLFTDMEMTPEVTLQYPDEKDLQQPVIRPEYDLFRYQKERIEADRNLNKVAISPVIAVFGQLGYGNPGYNMMQDKFDTYYMVGIRLKWKPWDWKTTHRTNLALDNQSALIQMQQETFELEQTRSVLQIDGELSQYLQKIDKDKQIVELQAAIAQNYRVQLKNGTITATEYIEVVNNESRARLEMQITRFNYLQTLTHKYLTAGKY